jgi:proteasome lid subunit RPN8/RPN11
LGSIAASSTSFALTPSSELVAAICAHAREEFPRECCGYLRGANGVPDEIVRCRNAQPDGEHPTQPGRSAETAFVIAGAELFEFARAFGSDRPPLIVYHSHTNGRAYWSDVDRENAAYPVHNLVIGVTRDKVTELALFAPDGTEVARFSPGC